MTAKAIERTRQGARYSGVVSGAQVLAPWLGGAARKEGRIRRCLINRRRPRRHFDSKTGRAIIIAHLFADQSVDSAAIVGVITLRYFACARNKVLALN
jgi:hypothetical protein